MSLFNSTRWEWEDDFIIAWTWKIWLFSWNCIKLELNVNCKYCIIIRHSGDWPSINIVQTELTYWLCMFSILICLIPQSKNYMCLYCKICLILSIHGWIQCCLIVDMWGANDEMPGSRLSDGRTGLW